MEVWLASAGDRVRLPCWPGEVEVTDTGLVEGRGGYNHTRVHWEVPGARGSVVLPDGLDVALLASPSPSKAVYLPPEPGPEAGG